MEICHGIRWAEIAWQYKYMQSPNKSSTKERRRSGVAVNVEESKRNRALIYGCARFQA